MKVDINTKYIKDDKGVNHFAIKNYKYTFDYGDKVTFDLQNLFKESKELSEYQPIAQTTLARNTYSKNI